MLRRYDARLSQRRREGLPAFLALSSCSALPRMSDVEPEVLLPIFFSLADPSDSLFLRPPRT